MLIVKEKDPAALLEFGPAGDVARGFGRDRYLDPGQPCWAGVGLTSAQEVSLVLVVAWEPTAGMLAACPDLSDAEVGPAGNLILLNDKGRSVALAPASSPAPDRFAGSFEAIAVWRMPRGSRTSPRGSSCFPTWTSLWRVTGGSRRRTCPSFLAPSGTETERVGFGDDPLRALNCAVDGRRGAVASHAQERH